MDASHTVISNRKMFSSHEEVALGSPEPWGEDHQLGKERDCGSRDSAAQKPLSGSPWPLTPRPPRCPNPEAPCRLRPSFPPAVGSRL